MRRISEKLKSQKGSATLFVLVAILFFTTILVSSYMKNINKLQTMDRDLSNIQQSYNKDIDAVYQEVEEKVNEKNT